MSAPVERASTILFDSVAEMESGRPGVGVYRYGLQGTATHWALCEALTELEPGAAGTVLAPSGLSAMTTALLALLSPGDELLAVDSSYGPTRIFCDRMLKRLGIATRYYDPLIGAGIADLISKHTRVILLESPGSLTMEVQDVPAICAVAKANGIATVIDNSWATPLYFPAIAAGCDVTVVAATKYIGGHADLMLGATSATPEHFARIERLTWELGQSVSADDAWLASRGLRTLAIRLEQHRASALKIASWLAEQPQVATVLHPALPTSPGHAEWRRDFRGSTGLFSFELAGDRPRAELVEALRYFGIGYSWGGFESLAIPVDPVRTATSAPARNLIRLHIGLEDPDDLIADLARALAAIG